MLVIAFRATDAQLDHRALEHVIANNAYESGIVRVRGGADRVLVGWTSGGRGYILLFIVKPYRCFLDTFCAE